MLLHWEQLVLHYGHELVVHRPHFETAGQTTYGLLCCRFSPEDYRLTASSGEHAEEKLLRSESWRLHIPRALSNWTPHNSPIITTIAINRSPCRACARLLIEALQVLHRQYPVSCHENRFLLASRGAYEDADMSNSTTRNDLIRLRDAGWELCVLQVGATLPPRGRILLQGIEDVVGHGFVRLG